MRRAWVLAGLLMGTTTAAARADVETYPPEEVSVVPASGSRFHQWARPNTAPSCCPPGVYPGIPGWTPAPGEMPLPVPPGGMTPPAGVPNDPAANLLDGGLTTPFATQTAGGGFQGRSFNEEFDGDFGAMFYRRTAVVGTTTQQVQTGTRVVITTGPNGQPIRTVVPVFANVTRQITRDVRVPVAGRYSGIMITDNDSARPVDRVYFGYSYYDGLGASLNPGLGGFTQNREMFGFEKTLLDGNASVGVRVPFLQLNGPAGLGGDAVGDLSVLVKYAFINNRETGNVASVGLVITTPTGADGGTLSDGTAIPHSVLFQPWAGFVRVFGRGYVQGISNMIVPTDSRDTLLWGNSLAAGYRLTDGDGLIPALVPTVEAHVRTPLNNRDVNGLVFLQDQVNLTGGMHLRWNRVSLSGAACVPVVGPRPWNIEALAYLNYRF